MEFRGVEGATYEGQWQDNKFHGAGNLTMKTYGLSWQAQWLNGSLDTGDEQAQVRLLQPERCGAVARYQLEDIIDLIRAVSWQGLLVDDGIPLVFNAVDEAEVVANSSVIPNEGLGRFSILAYSSQLNHLATLTLDFEGYTFGKIIVTPVFEEDPPSDHNNNTHHNKSDKTEENTEEHQQQQDKTAHAGDKESAKTAQRPEAIEVPFYSFKGRPTYVDMLVSDKAAWNGGSIPAWFLESSEFARDLSMLVCSLECFLHLLWKAAPVFHSPALEAQYFLPF